MKGWLLDTNVISELSRPKPKSSVTLFTEGQPLEQLFVSTVTFAEIRYGISLVSDSNRQANLQDWLHRTRSRFADGVLQVTEDIMLGASPSPPRDAGVRGLIPSPTFSLPQQPSSTA